MRHAGNFNPEWGYLAPAPSFARTIRIVVVAAAIGATGGAAVVFSLVDRPAAEETVAARTLAQPVDSPLAPAGAAVAAQSPADELQPLPQPQTDAHNASRQPVANSQAQAHARAARPASSESGTVSTTQHPTSAAALAEAPAITDVPAEPGSEPGPAPDTAQAPKKPVKKPTLTWRAWPPQPQPARGPLALLRPFGAQN